MRPIFPLHQPATAAQAALRGLWSAACSPVLAKGFGRTSDTMSPAGITYSSFEGINFKVSKETI